MTQQHRIQIDPPNIAVWPKIDANAWCDVVYAMFPGNMDHVMSCSHRTWCCTDETRQHRLFLHVMWRVLNQSGSRNADCDRPITIYLRPCIPSHRYTAVSRAVIFWLSETDITEYAILQSAKTVICVSSTVLVCQVKVCSWCHGSRGQRVLEEV